MKLIEIIVGVISFSFKDFSSFLIFATCLSSILLAIINFKLIRQQKREEKHRLKAYLSVEKICIQFDSVLEKYKGIFTIKNNGLTPAFKVNSNIKIFNNEEELYPKNDDEKLFIYISPHSKKEIIIDIDSMSNSEFSLTIKYEDYSKSINIIKCQGVFYEKEKHVFDYSFTDMEFVR
jgi:hypothetical protein